MTTSTILTAATFLALAALPLSAQQHPPDHKHGARGMTDQGHMMMHDSMGHGSMMGGSMMGGGMMGMMQPAHPGPGALLQAADALDLTGSQTERLTELRDRARTERHGYMQAMMATHQEAAATLGDAPGDLEAYEEALRQAADLMVEAHLSMARTALEARGLLTPEQREKARAIPMPMMDGHSRDGGMKGKGMHPGSPR